MATSSTNGILTTNGSGTYKVIVRGISMPLQISSSEGQAKTRRVFYPASTISANFALALVFRSWDHRERFNVWLRTFMENTVGGRGFNAAISVSVPERRFQRTAIPAGPIKYGEKVDDVTYPMTISFVGATNPLEIGAATRDQRSYFNPPAKGRETSAYFYPAGKQLKGAASLEGAVYDEGPGFATPSEVRQDDDSGLTTEGDSPAADTEYPLGPGLGGY